MQADWYFDFISPFAHLQHEVLLRDAPHLQRNYVPVLFAGLLSHFGNKGPAETPAKRTAIYHYCHWRAQQLKVAFKFPPTHPFNPLAALRLAIACGGDEASITAVFRAIYVDGADFSNADDWRRICAQLDIADGDAVINAQTVKDKLRANTTAAAKRGVFGVPTLMIGERCFWGEDMTEMALEYAADPTPFERGEYARLTKLPIGQSRKV